jgi:hypothetical protein
LEKTGNWVVYVIEDIGVKVGVVVVGDVIVVEIFVR